MAQMLPIKGIVSFAVVGCVLVLGAARHRDEVPQIDAPSTNDLPSFDVASLKPVSAPYSEGVHFTPGHAAGRAVTIKQLLKLGYGVTARQITGAPYWVDNEKFDFDARAAAADASQLRLMIRSLLVERCHLSVRSERRKSSFYVMTIGKAGLILPEVKPGEPLPTVKKRPGTGPVAGVFGMSGTLDELANYLSDYRPVDRLVIDETARQGKYLILFTWLQGEDFIGTLEEISGLEFEARSGPLDYYLVEHIERPTEN